MSPKLRAFLFVVPPVVLLDRLTKWAIVEHLPLHSHIQVIAIRRSARSSRVSR